MTATLIFLTIVSLASIFMHCIDYTGQQKEIDRLNSGLLNAARSLRDAKASLEYRAGTIKSLQHQLKEAVARLQNVDGQLRAALGGSPHRGVLHRAVRLGRAHIRRDAETAKQLTCVFEDFTRLIEKTDGVYCDGDEDRTSILQAWRDIIHLYPSMHYWVRASKDETARHLRANCQHKAVVGMDGKDAHCDVCGESLYKDQQTGGWQPIPF